MTIEQLDLFTDGYPTWTVPTGRPGREYTSLGGGWRTRWLNHRFGWAFYRAIGDEWEPFEPDLPYGVLYIHSSDEARRIVEGLARTLGDTAHWLAA